MVYKQLVKFYINKFIRNLQSQPLFQYPSFPRPSLIKFQFIKLPNFNIMIGNTSNVARLQASNRNNTKASISDYVFKYFNSYHKYNMRKTNLYLALLGLLNAYMIIGKLQVINMDKLPIQLYEDSLLDIPYSVANFGFAPFGKTMIGTLEVSPGMNLQCNDLDPDFQQDEQTFQNSFMLIPRGQCKFVTKALHAQDLGAQMAIIMDNIQNDHPIIMKDDGYGYKVKIPSIFISHENGEKLAALAQKSEKKIVLKIHFENTKSKKVNVTFYLQSTNRMSYHIVESFSQFYDDIQSYINFDLVYDMMECSYCNKEDCYFNNKYCSIDYPHGSSANGTLVIDQQLRETIMFENYTKQWWEYMECINEECYQITELQVCSSKCEQRVGVTDLKQAFNDSFTLSQNKYLKADLQNLKLAGIDKFPMVTINSAKMKGSLQGQFILDDICNSLESPPKSCMEYINPDIVEHQKRMYWGIIFGVIVASLVVFMFVCCRRMMKNRLTRDGQQKVDEMVSKYIEFYSERNNSRK